MQTRATRRVFALGSLSLVALGCHESGEAEVTPGEDLMQEHGVVERVLLIYEELLRRTAQGQAYEPSVLTGAAGIIRHFVEDYHEKNEEKFVFPRLEAKQKEVALVQTLRRQHQRGRELTDVIVRLAPSANSPELKGALEGFIRMYRPHAARENTVLFPAFREVIGGSAYRELGEQFEDEEHRRFGDHGFENTVAQLAKLETTLAIADLSRFTP